MCRLEKDKYSKISLLEKYVFFSNPMSMTVYTYSIRRSLRNSNSKCGAWL